MKNKESVFTSLTKKLEEPFKLSSLKTNNRRKRNMSKKSQQKSLIQNSPKIKKKTSKSPLRNSQDFKLKEQGKRLKLINRVELDRPILIAEKMDVLWTKPTEALPEINIARFKLEVSYLNFV